MTLCGPYSPWVASLTERYGSLALKSVYSVAVLHGSQTGATARFAAELAETLSDLSRTALKSELKVVLSSISAFNVRPEAIETGTASRSAPRRLTPGRALEPSCKEEGDPTLASTGPELDAQTHVLPCSSGRWFDRFDALRRFDFVIICISTWTDGRPPPSAADLIDYLEDLVTDFRVSKDYFACLRGLAVVGFGSSAYARYCTPAKGVYFKLKRLGAKPLAPLLKVDDAVNMKEAVAHWTEALLQAVHLSITVAAVPVSNAGTRNSDVPNLESSQSSASDGETKETTDSESLQDSDLEETQHAVHHCGGGSDTPNASGDVEEVVHSTRVSGTPLREMLTTEQRRQLGKEGYKIVGSHSAVKLCRWTKGQLRGRGGCYKHTFYGIQSHQCMEATPSLACANKCVFCWRHHKNPVGRHWKWKTDDAPMILDGILDAHYSMIKQLKGVQGVTSERFHAASQNVRHCALSLVGEPVMYPQIGELLLGLHAQRISTFLVTNAQFPEEMKSLPPVTQLYVSIDAASRDALKAIDRPLFPDFWERFLRSVDVIAKIPQRTVFRLTLVKKYNMQEAHLFGQLIVRGQPDFIEIKAVTYCGTSAASDITMQDIPWHEDVIAYANSILASDPRLLEQYALAAEHQHSCCVLVAHKRFYQNNTWLTWIDYDRFHELATASTSAQSFDALSYSIPAPSWAQYGTPGRGFDPDQQRVYVKGRKYRQLKRDAAQRTAGAQSDGTPASTVAQSDDIPISS